AGDRAAAAQQHLVGVEDAGRERQQQEGQLPHRSPRDGAGEGRRAACLIASQPRLGIASSLLDLGPATSYGRDGEGVQGPPRGPGPRSNSGRTGAFSTMAFRSPGIEYCMRDGIRIVAPRRGLARWAPRLLILVGGTLLGLALGARALSLV